MTEPNKTEHKIEPCKHEFMVTSWSLDKRYRHATSLMCKRCLLILDHEDLIMHQNMRSEMRRLAKEKAKEKK